MELDDDQGWSTPTRGGEGIIASLNSRLFIIKRLYNSISGFRIKRIIDSLYTSKIMYGLQLQGKVRLSEEDPKTNFWQLF